MVFLGQVLVRLGMCFFVLTAVSVCEVCQCVVT